MVIAPSQIKRVSQHAISGDLIAHLTNGKQRTLPPVVQMAFKTCADTFKGMRRDDRLRFRELMQDQGLVQFADKILESA